ncbi:TniQ family protein [Noviherbaspirillum sp. 1P10PC]|uniref:TniQ family protein n=1 Tax=Noviherbaspirillum sp. 1P10PC TaxID=3132292 RepID=UPI0039A3947B
MSQQPTYVPLRGAPRSLVTFLEPHSGESFSSYVERLAAKHDVALAVILSCLGLVSPSSKRPPAGYGVVLDEKHLQLFCTVSRLPADTVRTLLLSAYDGIALDLAGATSAEPDRLRKAAVAQWAYFSGSHYCPSCLKESQGAWQLSWKLPWSYCCPQHQCLLNKFCPYCNQRAARGRRDGWSSPVFHARVPLPGYCGNPLPHGQAARGKDGAPCGGFLGDAPATSVANFPGLLAVQERIYQMLRPDDTPSRKVAAASFFKEMRSLSALLLYSADVDDFGSLPEPSWIALQRHVDARKQAQAERKSMADGRTGPRPRSYIGTPEDPALMSAIVPLALTIADSLDDELHCRLQPLADRLQERSPGYRWAALEYFQFSDRLRIAFTQCFEARSTFNRRAGQRSLKAASASQPYAFRSCNVPQLIPFDLFEQSFAPLFPSLLENHARSFCSMALVKLLGHTWAEAARELDLPQSMHRFSNRAVILLNQQGFYDQFATELHRWAVQLSEQSKKIDYAAARRVFENFQDIPMNDWKSVCRAAELRVGNRGGRSRYAAAWLWAEITGGDWRLAPALQSKAYGEQQRDVYRAMEKTVLPLLAPHLRQLGKRLLLESGLEC